MSLQGQWVNSYNSLMTIYQNPDGLISGTYSSTTGGSGTYDLVGWAGLNTPTIKIGQPLSISILWRSNDGGKSDGSHEVSAMAGQLVLSNEGDLSIELIHMFAETNPRTTPPIGVYPDKLIFLPYKSSEKPILPISSLGNPNSKQGAAIIGDWSGMIDGNTIKLGITWGHIGYCAIEGELIDIDRNALQIYGFTDTFATVDGYSLQGITFSAYKDDVSRKCLSFTGWLDLESGQLKLTKLEVSATPNDGLWYQVDVSQGNLYKIVPKKNTSQDESSLGKMLKKQSTKKEINDL